MRLAIVVVLVLAAAARAQLPPHDADSTPAQLDARAFEAFADGRAERLAMLKAAGGDPERHARTSRDALFDALRPGRAVAVLEFVLRTGVDTNLPQSARQIRPPLLMAQPDLDKMRLLLDHGADPSIVGPDRYT